MREDLRSGDLTTESLIPANAFGKAKLNFRADGIACGLPLAEMAFRALDADIFVEILISEGTRVAKGATAMRIQGDARAILSAERVALNFAQRLSAIATLTAQYVAQTKGTRARIADTRKTTPGLRIAEKYAVRMGGGANHRYALDDMILIKDNHIALCGGISQAVEKARKRVGHAVKIEVECDNLKQVEEAIAAHADIILLDNMTNQQLRDAVALIDSIALSEASGGVNLDTVSGIAQTGVDLISVGALTHGVRSLDIGLDVENLMKLGRPRQHFAQTDSTNRVALDWADAPHGALVWADAQSAGRGRLGRSWSSPAGKGLYFSLVLRPTEPNPARYSLLAGLGAARAIERVCDLPIACKWPNDLLCHLAKKSAASCAKRRATD